MDTTPFGAPPAPAPTAAALPRDASRRSWARSPRVLVGGGLGVLALALAGAFALTTGGSDPYATTAGPVLPTAVTPTATPTTTPVVSTAADGRNPFFALVAATTTAGATTGPSGLPAGSVVGAGTSTGASGASGAVRVVPASPASPASRVVVVPGPVVTQRVEVPVPGPTVTVQAPAPAPVVVPVPTAATVELTYLGPDAGVPGGQRFRVSSAGASSVTTLQPGHAVSAVAPASWLVFTRISDGGHAVVTGGVRAYDLAVGVPVRLS